MYCKKEPAYKKTYPGEKKLLLRILGVSLIAAGVLLLIFCIPGWAWLSLIGIALIAAGVFLLQ